MDAETITMQTDIIYNESCLTGLSRLPDNSIDCCVTSPPYWGLRDYGHCDQIGLEKTPDLYVQNMVKVFMEVYRILKPDGTLWLNIGDSYIGGGRAGEGKHAYGGLELGRSDCGLKYGPPTKKISGLKSKDLCGIPWRVAFALQSKGWYLRSDIIWHKPNPMPESVKDRPTKAHEYIFLLTKSAKYYYDAESIKIPSIEPDDDRGSRGGRKRFPTDIINGIRRSGIYPMANKRTVWNVTTKPYRDAHFAVFPEDLITPCIIAGCPPGGVVLDPFMGSGTTAIVCIRSSRHYIGYEINADYIKMAERRIARINHSHNLFEMK